MILGKDSDWHLMLDLETLGTRPTSKIIQVGAVLFTPRKSSSGYANFSETVSYFNLPEELDDLFTTDKETIEWWGEQDSELVHSLFRNIGADVEVTLVGLTNFIETNCGPDVQPYIWCKGSGFDTSILAHHYKMLQGKLPAWWNFRKERDLRTLLEAAKSLGYVPGPRTTQLHNALEDAKYQANELLRIDNFFYELGVDKDAIAN